MFWHKTKTSVNSSQKNELIKDINSQVKKLEQLNLKADPQFEQQLHRLKNCDKDDLEELKMSFNLIKADLQLSVSEPHEIELQKVMLQENLKGLIECVNAKDEYTASDIDFRVSDLVKNMGELKLAADQGFTHFIDKVLN